ncbi:MAG: tetratricopeptide repeat protein [Chitinophagaceae bacterium]|nr:tetratricopeptide repeat protein [Chitinophagaceae bacterium]
MTSKIMVALAVVTLIVSCSLRDTDSEKNNSSILNSPRFSGITDSINRFPGSAELYVKRALMLSQLNEHDAASADYKKAYELSGDEHVMLDYASNLMLSQNVNKAIQLLEEGIKKFPSNTEFSRRLAEIHLQKGDARDALNEYDKILLADSSNFEAWYDKGLLLAKLKDTAGAIEALEKSFSLVPISYSGMALAGIYVAQKNPRALTICDMILARDTAEMQTEPVFMKGAYFADTKQYDEALKQFDECIKRDWKMTDAYIEKGIILFERRNYDEALKQFTMTTTVSNTDADGYFWLGRCYEMMGKKEEAIANYERALALDDTFTEARAALRRLSS